MNYFKGSRISGPAYVLKELKIICSAVGETIPGKVHFSQSAYGFELFYRGEHSYIKSSLIEDDDISHGFSRSQMNMRQAIEDWSVKTMRTAEYESIL